jgi:uncharacterized protein HemY
MDSLGRMLIVLGLVVAGMGLLFVLAGRVPFFGRLPGDITIQTDKISCFFPIVTMLLVSVVLTVVLNLVLWVLRR